MFIDASAVIGIIADEVDRPNLTRKLALAERVFLSAVVYYEAATGLARQRRCSPKEARELIDLFMKEISAEFVAIDETVGREALAAFDRYGKGRHKAALNMGDCFSYGCAKALDMPLLFKGNDFGQTDIVPA